MRRHRTIAGMIDDISAQIGDALDYAAAVRDQVSMEIGDSIDYAKEQWLAALDKWNSALQDLQAQLATHNDLRAAAEALGPGELAAWDAQNQRVAAIQAGIENLKQGLANAVNYVSDNYGVSGLRVLSVAPAALVPIAVIVGSTAAVVAVTAALYEYDRQLQQKWAYVQAHPEMTPAQVGTMLENSGGAGGVTSSISKAAMWIGGAGLLIVFAPQIKLFFNSLGKRR